MEKIDTKKMYQVYDSWPEIAEQSFEQKNKKVNFDEIDHIVFAGMGGSGAIGDIFSSILSKTKIHVDIVKGYLLPSTVKANSLVIVLSISGNTSETLNVLSLAHRQKCKVISFSSGGKMEDYCKRYNIEHRKIKKFHSPRASFPSFLYSMLNVLEPVIPIKQTDVKESISRLKSLRDKIYSNNLSSNNSSLELANWINGIPLIYYPHGLQAAAIRFKNSLQENGKLHAMAEDVIEACHNGIVSWEKPSTIQPILIEGKDDFNKTKKRWEILKKYFNEMKIEYKEISSTNGSILTKLINLIYLLDYTSIYYSILSDTDPTPVKSIDFVKNRLEN